MLQLIFALMLCLMAVPASAKLSEFDLGGKAVGSVEPPTGVDSMSDHFTIDTAGSYQEVSVNSGYLVLTDGGYYRPTANYDYTQWIYTADINSHNQYAEVTGKFGNRMFVSNRGSYSGGLYTGYYASMEAGGINMRYCPGVVASTPNCTQIGFIGSTTYTIGQVYKLRLEATGTFWEIFVDDVPVLSGTDTTYQPAGNKIGMGLYGGNDSAGSQIDLLEGGNMP